MLNLKKISLLALIGCSLVFASCKGHGRLFSSDVVAQVGKETLTKDDIKINFPVGTSYSDSLQMVEVYVDSWVRKHIKIQEAEKVLEKSGVDVEALIADYRNSLLTNRLDKYYIEQRVDTIIAPELVAEYYDLHKPEFKLDRNILKGRVVKFPIAFRQQNKLKELMNSSNSERQQDFTDLTIKNDLNITNFDEWVGLDELLHYLPTIRNKNYDYLLSPGKINELSDGDYKYYIQVSEYKDKGEQAPLEWVNAFIWNIIYNQRCSNIIKAKEDSLYNAALEDNFAKIHLETNKE